MGMNGTPSGERVHIGFFGRRNAGKSSLVNCVTGQNLSVVSDVSGTTTDPVYKAMELLPVGPVMIVDTPGFDDEGSLGELRVKKTRQILHKTDVAVLVVDAVEGICRCDRELLELFRKQEIPYLVVINKSDLVTDVGRVIEAPDESYSENWNPICVSAVRHENIHELKERITSLAVSEDKDRRLVADLIRPMEMIILVVPIDSAAPKGRLILPQQQTIRDILEAGAVSLVVRDRELADTLQKLGRRPDLVITDSQVFEEVAAVVPDQVPLTSFSILMARYKGLLATAVQGVMAIDRLQDGDRILIAEGCTHHRQCDDIGTVKIPRFLQKYTGKDLLIETSSGMGFPEALSPYALVIHCGGCMLNEREMRWRMKSALEENVPITNYGTAIAHMKGILNRSLEIFPDLQKLLKEGK